jgi:hypothetical protein
LRLLKSNRKCYIKGFDIGDSIIEVIEKLDMLYVSADFKRDGIIPNLYKELLDYRETIMKKYKIDIYDASNESTFQRKLEIINTITALSEDTNNTYELIDRCKKIFYTKDSEGICLITNHKAKGLENDVVYHLCPSLLPDKRAKKDWEIQTERNLEYVLYTRTKDEFYTISETDFPPPQGSKDIKELVEHLNIIEQKLKILYSGDSEKPIEKSTVTKKIEIQTPIVVEKPNIPITETKNNNDISKFERIMLNKTVEQCYQIFNDFGVTSDIRIVSIAGNSIEITEKCNKDTINVEVDNCFDNVITKIIGIG